MLTVHIEETAALGAAMLAGLATKTFSSLEDAADSMVLIKERFIPSEKTETYMTSNMKSMQNYIKVWRLFSSAHLRIKILLPLYLIIYRVLIVHF